MTPKRRQANVQPSPKRRRQDVGSAAVELKGLHFEVAEDGASYVELTSLAKRVQKKRDGVPALKAVWRRAGFDDTLIPAIAGVSGLAFPKQRGKPRDKLMPAADTKGLQAYVRELDQKDVENSARLLTAVAAKLGDAPVELESRHKVMALEPGTHVHVPIVEGCPRMVLPLLLEAFGIKDARHYVQQSLIPYLAGIGARIHGTVQLNLQSDGNRLPPLCKYLEEPVQEYERALAARSQGLLYGRSAWNDGRDTWLIDFPLLVLVINRLRTPQARRFQAASLEQSLLMMSGREEVAKSLANYWCQERMQRPDDTLLQFVGAVADHELSAANSSSSAAVDIQPTNSSTPPVDMQQIARICSETVTRALPEMMCAVAGTFKQMWRDSNARQTEWMDKVLAELRRPSSRQIVNVNTSHRDSDDLQRINLEVGSVHDAARIRHSVLPVSKFVRQQWRREWSAVPHNTFVGTFATLLYSRKLKDLDARPLLYAGQLNRQVITNERAGAL